MIKNIILNNYISLKQKTLPKKLSLLLFLFFCLISCVEQKEECACLSEEQEKAFDALSDFENLISELHEKSKSEPFKIIEETQDLVNQTLNSTDSLKNSKNKLDYLYSLRSEIFYKTEQYQKSINEIIDNAEIYLGSPLLSSHDNIVIACGYVKLREYKIAYKHIEKAGKGYYLNEFILANFYEVTGEIKKAKNIYLKIIEKKRSQYKHYELAKNRLIELEKKSPKLLSELYFPTYNPKYGIGK